MHVLDLVGYKCSNCPISERILFKCGINTSFLFHDVKIGSESITPLIESFLQRFDPVTADHLPQDFGHEPLLRAEYLGREIADLLAVASTPFEASPLKAFADRVDTQTPDAPGQLVGLGPLDRGGNSVRREKSHGEHI